MKCMRTHRMSERCGWGMPFIVWCLFGCSAFNSDPSALLLDSGDDGSLYSDGANHQDRDAMAADRVDGESTKDYSHCVPNSPNDGSCPWICPEVCDGIDNDCDGRTDELSEACDLPNATPRCEQTQCVIVQCAANYGDCDQIVSNGCETPLDQLTNCGACNEKCTGLSCAGGVCSKLACESGLGDCNMDSVDGCEISLRTTEHCGSCAESATCGPLDHATATCTTGTCRVESCTAGYGDCDDTPSNGCETPLNANQNCGACANDCTGLPNVGDVACNSGVCSIQSCSPGYADCSAEAGCETPLGTVTDCAVCGDACPALPDAGYPRALQSGCSAYKCSVAQCEAGYGDCNNNLSDGCEVSVNTLGDCGSCGAVCDLANAGESCATGTCTLGSCDYGYANCNSDNSDGCEYQQMDVPSGLVGFWSLNETSGTIAADGSGAGHNGMLTNMNGDEWTSGAVGGALQLDGTNDYVQIGDIGTEIKSLSFWMTGVSTGAKYPSVTGSTYNEWSNPSRAYANDGSYATMGDWSTKTQDWSGFGFNLPSGAIINGVEVKIEYKMSDPFSSAQSHINLELSWNAGSNYTSTGYSTGDFMESDGERVGSWGSSTDTWGRSWTANEINNSFRIRLEGYSLQGVTNYVDYITVNVFYFQKVINLNGTHQIELVGGNITATGFPGATSIYVDGTAGSAITAGWHHVALTNTTGVSASSLQLGRAGAGYFDGAIDDVRAYNRVLSAGDVSFLSGHANCP